MEDIIPKLSEALSETGLSALVVIVIATLHAILSSTHVYHAIRGWLGRPEVEAVRTKPSPAERLKQLSESMSKTSAEFDEALGELESIANTRRDAVASLEKSLSELEDQEKALKEKVSHLENVPLPVAEYFASLTQAGETRSARRDYLLFAAGVLMSVLTAVVLKLLGWA